MMHFKIFSGYDDKNPISIDESELSKAIYAQVSGKVAMLKSGTIAGASISKILPDFDKVQKIYNPSGPDRIPTRVESEHYFAVENAGEMVKAKMEGRTPQLRQPESVTIHTRGMTSLGEIIKQ